MSRSIWESPVLVCEELIDWTREDKPIIVKRISFSEEVPLQGQVDPGRRLDHATHQGSVAVQRQPLIGVGEVAAIPGQAYEHSLKDRCIKTREPVSPLLSRVSLEDCIADAVCNHLKARNPAQSGNPYLRPVGKVREQCRSNRGRIEAFLCEQFD